LAISYFVQIEAMNSSTNPDSQAKSGAPRAVTLLALSMVVFSLFNIVLLSILSDQSIAKYLQRGVRFFFTCVLAYFLFRGARWARWVTIVIALLVAVYSVLGFALLPPSVPIFLRAWLLVIALFCLIIALLLLFSKDIVEHFVPHHSK
jgi:hypothetical protein